MEQGKHLAAICGEMQKAATRINEDGIFIDESANETISRAAALPEPKDLYRGLIYEGEHCCLFGDANCCKTIVATQIGITVSKMGLATLYLDCELSDKQFQMRFTNTETGELYQFPENFRRVTLNPARLNIATIEADIVDGISRLIDKWNAKFVVIDNVSWLLADATNAEAAGVLSQKLHNLTREKNLTLLSIGHANKRNMQMPLSQNDLSGSKKLMNFFDSSFVIGASAKDSRLRYIKTIKSRMGEYAYPSEAVLVCEISREGGYLHLSPIGTAREKEHLRVLDDEERDSIKKRAKEMSERGMSQRAIGQELGISASSVNKILKK